MPMMRWMALRSVSPEPGSADRHSGAERKVDALEHAVGAWMSCLFPTDCVNDLSVSGEIRNEQDLLLSFLVGDQRQSCDMFVDGLVKVQMHEEVRLSRHALA